MINFKVLGSRDEDTRDDLDVWFVKSSHGLEVWMGECVDSGHDRKIVLTITNRGLLVRHAIHEGVRLPGIQIAADDKIRMQSDDKFLEEKVG